MALTEVYLDNSATTRVLPEVAELCSKIYLEEYGNPSSMHHMGVESERRLREASETLSSILKCKPSNLIFTSCGTEADNLALIGCARANKRKGQHLITTKIEHPAILETMKYLESEGYEVTYLSVNKEGLVTPEQVAEAVRPDTILVSVMHTNNEVGAVQPIEEIAKAIKAKNKDVLFHVDAVQGFGKFAIVPKRMGIDLLSASGHKIHAPKGIGFLYVADGVKIRNIIYGGGQQGGMRSGTENVAGTAGMALAAKILYKNLAEDTERLYEFKEYFKERMQVLENVHFNGPAGRAGAPHVISLTVPGIRSEVLLHTLEDKKIYVSSGSACASNHPSPSATLTAIGLPGPEIESTIRISTSIFTTKEDMDRIADELIAVVPMLRRYTRH